MQQRLWAEGLGTAMLLIGVVGSGIMAETLTGDIALALLANAIATGSVLYVLITVLGPISGAHFNPVVTLAFFLRKEITAPEAALFIGVQILGGILGVWFTHVMCDQSILQFSSTPRAGTGQWSSEIFATFGREQVMLVGCRDLMRALARFCQGQTAIDLSLGGRREKLRHGNFQTGRKFLERLISRRHLPVFDLGERGAR